MIKQTFYNINDKKRKKILSAIKKELINNGWDNSKVVNICKNAGIPRSAFYRYFDSLEDSFEALLNHIRDKKVNEIKDNYNSENGNIFDIARMNLIKLLENDDEYLILQSVYRSNFAKSTLKKHYAKIPFSPITQIMEKDKIVAQIIRRMIRQLVTEYYEMKLEKEVIIKQFDIFIDMLKHGYLNMN